MSQNLRQSQWNCSNNCWNQFVFFFFNLAEINSCEPLTYLLSSANFSCALLPRSFLLLSSLIILVKDFCEDTLHRDFLHWDALHRDAMHKYALYKNALHRNALHKNALHRNALHRNVLHRNALKRNAFHRNGSNKIATYIPYASEMSVKFTFYVWKKEASGRKNLQNNSN